MTELILDEIKDLVIADVTVKQWGGYEPTGLTLVLDDGTRLLVEASSVMYDQYSSSPCLRMRRGEA